MTTVPKQPIPRPDHVTRPDYIRRKELADRSEVARHVSYTLDRDGPRAVLKK